MRLSPGDFPAGRRGAGGGHRLGAAAAHADRLHPARLGGGAAARHRRGSGRRQGSPAPAGLLKTSLRAGRAGGGVRPRGGPAQGAARRRGARRRGHGRPLGGPAGELEPPARATRRRGRCCCWAAAGAQEALAAVGVATSPSSRGKRLAVLPAELGVLLRPVAAVARRACACGRALGGPSLDAGRGPALREGRADAVGRAAGRRGAGGAGPGREAAGHHRGRAAPGRHGAGGARRVRGPLPGRGPAGHPGAAGRGGGRAAGTRRRRRGCWARWRRTWATRARRSSSAPPATLRGQPGLLRPLRARRRSPTTSCSRAPRRSRAGSPSPLRRRRRRTPATSPSSAASERSASEPRRPHLPRGAARARQPGGPRHRGRRGTGHRTLASRSGGGGRRGGLPRGRGPGSLAPTRGGLAWRRVRGRRDGASALGAGREPAGALLRSPRPPRLDSRELPEAARRRRAGRLERGAARGAPHRLPASPRHAERPPAVPRHRRP